MADYKPKTRANLKWETLQLSPEEGFLLSRVDGATSVEALRHMTGMDEARFSAALRKLEESGALEPAPTQAPRTRDVPKTVVQPMVDATFEETPRAHDLDDVDSDDDLALIAQVMADLNLDPSLEGEPTGEGDAVDDDSVEDDDAPANVAAARDAADEAKAPSSEPLGDSPDDDDDEKEQDAKEEENAEAAEVEEGNYRKLFETTLRELPQEEREKRARMDSGAVLMALCFDPLPQVITGLMENSEVGFPHARLIARHHRTPQGLERLFMRSEFVRDGQTQRYLLANPMLSEAQFKRVLQPKPLAQVYKWSLSRDLPERNRSKVRLLLRSKWGTADGEERANLIWSTEGRCLQFLIGLSLDSKATTLLCARSIHSVMLIQSLARFTGTPPPLLSHLERQPIVKRQPNLRLLILQHPNCPSELKRKKR